MDYPRTLVVLHYHLRPAGVRRVIETALPALIHEALPQLKRVVILTGEASPDGWEERLSAACALPLEFIVVKGLNYTSEFVTSPRLRQRLGKLIGPDAFVWAHNLSVGRNFGLLADLPEVCEAIGAKLLLHHHDWWFDNRWDRVAKRNFPKYAKLTFPESSNIIHATLTRREMLPLEKYLPCLWLPNPVQIETSVIEKSNDWFMPCRVLRRKNLAEALLLKRWIAPTAKLAVMGAASSPIENDYFSRLQTLNEFEFSAGHRSGTIAVTSLLEGFGLPFIEAAAARRPFIGRFLQNASPDIQRAGCSLPLRYREVRVSRDAFDFESETRRQNALWKQWTAALPAEARALTSGLTLARNGIPFSRLTLTAQLEVIAQNPSWTDCERWNPALVDAVRRGKTPAASLNKDARSFFSPVTYAQRFWQQVRRPGKKPHSGAFTALLQQKMATTNLYPLLMAEVT